MIEKLNIDKNRKRVNFLELFLPVIVDIMQINSESNTKEVSNNAWNLTDEEYHKITRTRDSAVDDQKIIIID